MAAASEGRLQRCAASFIWAYAVWMVLTWTATAEQLVTGAIVACAVTALSAPLGPVARPWRLLDPRVLVATIRLILTAAARIVMANVQLARRILAPSRPLASGMIVVPTGMLSDRGIAGVGLISSLVVDNQLVDLDRRHHQLQYHAIDAYHASPNQEIEALLRPVMRSR